MPPPPTSIGGEYFRTCSRWPTTCETEVTRTVVRQFTRRSSLKYTAMFVRRNRFIAAGAGGSDRAGCYSRLRIFACVCGFVIQLP
eukprot:621522-Prorocentrum_minimum.AAC.4